MASLISDSDMFIDTLRRREPARTRIGALIRSGDLATTSMSVYELYVGARTDEEAVRIARLLEDVEVFELDAPAARRAAEVYRFLQSAGLRVEQPDRELRVARPAIQLVDDHKVTRSHVGHEGHELDAPLSLLPSSAAFATLAS